MRASVVLFLTVSAALAHADSNTESRATAARMNTQMAAASNSAIPVTSKAAVAAAAPEPTNKICFRSLREYARAIQERAAGGHEIKFDLGGKAPTRKALIGQRDEVKADSREVALAYQGSIPLSEYGKEVKDKAVVNGKELPYVRYVIDEKGLELFREDLVETIDMLKKSLRDNNSKDEQADAYNALLKDFLDDFSDKSDKWVAEKARNYFDRNDPREANLFSFIDSLVMDHANENRLIRPGTDIAQRSSFAWVITHVPWRKVGKRFWRRISNRGIDLILWGIAGAAWMLYTHHHSVLDMNKALKELKKHSEEQAQVVTEKETGDKVRDTKSALLAMATKITSTNIAFRGVLSNDEVEPQESWQKYSHQYSALSEQLVQIFKMAEGLSPESTATKSVANSFIKDLSSRLPSVEKFRIAENQTPTKEETQSLAKSLANDLFLKSLLQGKKKSKKELKDATLTVTDYKTFCDAFIREAQNIAMAFKAAAENIDAEASLHTAEPPEQKTGTEN